MGQSGERVFGEDERLRETYVRGLLVYEHAVQHCHGKSVLDLGCGEGRGIARLADAAQVTVGLDHSQQALTWASRNYARPNLAFVVGDMAKVPFPNDSFDVICCFQVIEHVTDADLSLREVCRLLRSGGHFLVSTPNRIANPSIYNPYHSWEYSPEEFQTLLNRHFWSVELWGVFGSERVMRYRKAHSRRVQRLVGLDVLGLREVLPKPIVTWLYSHSRSLVRRWSHRMNREWLQTLDLAEFSILRQNPDDSPDLLAVCAKEESYG